VRHTGCTLFFVPRLGANPMVVPHLQIADFYELRVWTCFNLKLESHNQQSRKLYKFNNNDPEEYLARDVAITY
jgi:hypothetical protein